MNIPDESIAGKKQNLQTKQEPEGVCNIDVPYFLKKMPLKLSDDYDK